jgi:hypothetical protein
MTFRVLQSSGRDAERWREVLTRFPPGLRDLHYTPEYGNIYRDTYGYEPLLVVYESGSQLVVQALVRRALNGLPFLAGSETRDRYTDTATPYGFGGPLLCEPEAANAPECLRAFDRAYCGWCKDERIAAEFTCLHPVLGNHAIIMQSEIVDPVVEKEVVVIDLTQPRDALWSAVSRGTRSSIKRALRDGVVVEQVAPDAVALAQFRELYIATMQRRGANARWFFPQSYFADCVRHMGAGGSALFFARCEGELAAAYLLLNDARRAYYHFGASAERWTVRRPSNALMYETLLWAQSQGLASYHLGGGVTSDENDSLLRFKSSFGGVKTMLYTYGRVLHEDVYRQLCELKREHERRTCTPVANPGYFPFYRR